MAASTRPPASRTPPFVLVGLLVLVCVLAYNYWSLSSTNAELLSQVETLTQESKSMKSKRDEDESQLQLAREEKSKVQSSLDAAKISLEKSENSLNSMKVELTKFQADATGCQEKMGACDESLKTVKAELDTVKGEKDALAKKLDECGTKTCAAGDCIEPIKEFVKAFAQILTVEQMTAILDKSSVDTKALLDGVEFAKPQAQQPAANQENAGGAKVNKTIVKMEVGGEGGTVAQQPGASKAHTSSTDNINIAKESHDQSNDAKKENANPQPEKKSKEENKNGLNEDGTKKGE